MLEGLFSNLIKWKPNEKTLPMKGIEGYSFFGSRVMPIFLTFLASIFIYLPIVAGGFLAPRIISVICSLFIILLAIFLFVHKTTLVISEGFVESNNNLLFKRIKFKESLSNYKGIERTTRATGGRNNRIFYEIILKHKTDSKRDITLFNSYSDKNREDSWNNFSSTISKYLKS